MGYADPQTLTFPTAGAVSLPRTGSGTSNSNFTSASGNTKLEISHQTTSRNRVRSTVRVTTKDTTADPLIPAQNLQFETVVYMVVDRPAVGLTVAQLKDTTDAFATWLTTGSAANVVKLHGKEI